MGVKFVDVRRDWRGNITQFLTNTGQVVSVHQARVMALSGEVDALSDLLLDGNLQMSAAVGTDAYEERENFDEARDF
ncbi:MAG: hypothetical protein A2201_08270 [Alicyclobacillus sp. RIFOXYA1_FULL_53_8]|nr:MAG: hypothetical protein A2201_08270 [Alicyclobacillus sp. RIFOXYA1_FULL_53_8]